MILVDSNIVLDIVGSDPTWRVWSRSRLQNLALTNELAINPIVYAEASVSFSAPALFDRVLADLGIDLLDLPREAAFLAGKAYVEYRRRGGAKTNVLPDFFIGAHAAALGCPLITRDTRRYASSFPSVRLIAPHLRTH